MVYIVIYSNVNIEVVIENKVVFESSKIKSYSNIHYGFNHIFSFDMFNYIVNSNDLYIFLDIDFEDFIYVEDLVPLVQDSIVDLVNIKNCIIGVKLKIVLFYNRIKPIQTYLEKSIVEHKIVVVVQVFLVVLLIRCKNNISIFYFVNFYLYNEN